MIGLVRTAGTGTGTNPFQPAVTDWAGAIDLRPDAAQQPGWWIVSTTDPVDLAMGDDLDAVPSSQIRRAIENRLGVTLNGQTLRRLIADLLIVHADDDSPSKWNRLRAGWDGVLRVFLGEEIWSMPVPSGGSTFTDDFNTADTGTLGADLTWTEVVGDWSIVSNTANCVTGSGNNFARADHDVSTTDHYAQALVVLLSTTTDGGAVCCRFSSSATTAYMGWMRRNASVTYRLRKVVTGAITDLTSVSTTAPAAGSTLKLTCNGTSLEMFYAGASVSTVTDSAISTGTRGGLSAAPTGANRVQFDDFEVGDLGGGGGGIAKPLGLLLRGVG